MTITSLHHFHSIHPNVTLPRHQHWWPVINQRIGEVNALANLRGFPRITNGIEVYIETEVGDLLLVHREWFVYDKGGQVPRTQSEGVAQSLSSEEKKLAQVKKLLAGLGIEIPVMM